MHCGNLLGQVMDRNVIHCGEKARIEDGRILNDLDTEYFIRASSDRGSNYFGINYCPFCGRPLSHGLWVAEKKK
jgi:hypothetical protein